MAFLFSLLFFAFLTFLGAAAVELLRPWRSSLRCLLIAPGVGAAVLVLPVFILNRAGFPVRQFALPLGIALTCAAAMVWWRGRPRIPLRPLTPFMIVLLCAAVAAGYPLLLDGFNWISYGNNDMCSYVLSAHRFADHGYNQLPDRAALLENRDVGASYWFSYAIDGARCGSDLLLAWLISVTRRTGFELYMPALLALHLSLICASGALVLRNSRLRVAAVTSCAWIAISPLNTLGTMYQLMPQVFGVTLLAISAAVLLEPVRIAGAGDCLRFSIFGGGLVAMLTVAYYEILPFLLVAVAVYHAVQLARRKETFRQIAAPALGTVAVIAIVLRTWAFSLVPFLEYQAGRSFAGTDPKQSLFPYYLVPSGLANLWGFLPIGAGPAAGAVTNAAIAAGGLLLIAAIAACLWQAAKGQPAAVIACVMFAVGAELFLRRGDFGLFKLAMYTQPFLLSSLVLAWFQISGRWLRAN